MDPDEFLKQIDTGPKTKSKLAPHWPAIQKLRAAGCTFVQINEFLKQNGVSVSLPGLSTYVKRREQKAEGKTEEKPAATVPASSGTEPSERAKELKKLFSEGKPVSPDQQEPTQESASSEPAESLSDLEFRKAIDPKNNDTFDKYESASSLSNRFKPKGK